MIICDFSDAFSFHLEETLFLIEGVVHTAVNPVVEPAHEKRDS